MFALLFVGISPTSVSAGNRPKVQPQPAIYVSTWGDGVYEITDTVPVTYTSADILMIQPGTKPTETVVLKWFDGLEAGLMPYRQWKHNINAIYISPTVTSKSSSMNGGPFYASFTQDQQKGIPGISGWVDGYDIVYWDGYTFTRWFEGEDVGLNTKTQEKIDSLDMLPMPPPFSAFIDEDCEAYLLISTQGPGHVPAPVSDSRRKPVIKFRGEDILGFCATNLGGDTTTGFWELYMDGSELEPKLRPRDVDSISTQGVPFLVLGLRNRARPDHSKLFAYNLIGQTVMGPLSDFAALGINSPIDALHLTLPSN